MTPSSVFLFCCLYSALFNCSDCLFTPASACVSALLQFGLGYELAVLVIGKSYGLVVVQCALLAAGVGV